MRRLPVPVGANMVNLKAYLERVFVEVETEFARHAEVLRDLTAMRLIDGVGSRWFWDDTGITAIDPGATYIRANSVNLNGVTEIYISETDAFGRKVIAGGDDGADMIGQPLILTSQTSSAFVSGLITTQTDHGDWLEWGVSVQDSAGNPSQDELFEFRWYPSEALLTALDVKISVAIGNIMAAARRAGDV